VFFWRLGQTRRRHPLLIQVAISQPGVQRSLSVIPRPTRRAFTSGVRVMLRRYGFEIILSLLIICGIITFSFWI
jgi:hypothetical protein